MQTLTSELEEMCSIVRTVICVELSISNIDLNMAMLMVEDNEPGMLRVGDFLTSG